MLGDTFFSIRVKTIWTYCYSICTKIQLSLIGQILLSEVFSFFFILNNFHAINKLFKNIVFRTIFFSLIWLLFFQVISDIYNGSSFYNYVRGWSVILFSIISIITLTILICDSSNSILIFMTGLTLSNIIFNNSDLTFDLTYENTNFFKIKFVPFLNPLLLIIYAYFHKKSFKLLGWIILLIYSLICFYFDARSNGLIFLSTIILVYFIENKIRLSAVKFLFFLSILYLFFIVYSVLVSENVINGSNSVTQFSKMDNKYNPFELLYYGRSEIPVLFSSIVDKPIFGHGSWGVDKFGKYSYELSFITKSPRVFFSNYIRAHSILFGYFAYAGIFAFITLLFLFSRLFRFSYELIISNKVDKSIKHIIIFYALLMLWHMLFSPIGTLRYDFVYFCSIILSIHFNINNKSESFL